MAADSSPSFADEARATAAFAQGLHQAFATSLKQAASTGLFRLDPERAAEIQARFGKEYAELWVGLLGGSAQAPQLRDRRFAGDAWRNNRFSTYTAALYLLNARALLELAEAVQADAKTRQRIRFAVQQWVDAAAPSNVWALNPDALTEAVRSGGESLRRGMDNLLGDMLRGKLTQTDESQFEIGRNVATTEGAVVFENPWFQLIDYRPLTPRVHERPLLIVPPCINKYYILDLQPSNSLVRHALEQGHRVLLMSWRNPDASCGGWTWDDYVEQGVLQAIRVAGEIAAAARASAAAPARGRARAPGKASATAVAGEPGLNALGFCIGGTLLGTALAVLAARGQRPVHSATLLTTLLDFSDTGVLDVFVDEAQVAMREATIGRGGLLAGAELAAAFSSLRPNDLTWNYVVGNYLKGETPPPFDLLYWNADSTNLPGPFLAWYLRNTYLENKLSKPDALRVCGTPLDLSRIELPAYVYASREDHIVPWTTAYASARTLGGPTRFVLGASGHIAGVINPPASGKRSHWLLPEPKGARGAAGRGALPEHAQQWLDKAGERPGSWWPDWSAWLAGHAGALQDAPSAYGGGAYAAIEPAPGRYVRVRA
ncbi:MAG: alpha/beta fold hydrolase [Betaproteobacteria bacterium]|nr:alpha/beta fold hydrolase [Betaproteobacteria bacterium]